MFALTLQYICTKPTIINFLGLGVCRLFHKDSFEARLIASGGLEKLQGGYKEVEYFTRQNQKQALKINESHTKLKCEYSTDNWDEFEKHIDHLPVTQICSISKNKNCTEEAFFLEEQNNCIKIINDKFHIPMPKIPKQHDEE